MHKSVKTVGCILVTIGLAHVVKCIMHRNERRSGWHKIRVEDEKRTCSRYGSNPIHY